MFVITAVEESTSLRKTFAFLESQSVHMTVSMMKGFRDSGSGGVADDTSRSPIGVYAGVMASLSLILCAKVHWKNR